MHPCRQLNRLYKDGFLGIGGSTPSAPPPPPVPTATNAAAAAADQRDLHTDATGMTYASTLLTGSAQPVNPSSVQKSVLMGG